MQDSKEKHSLFLGELRAGTQNLLPRLHFSHCVLLQVTIPKNGEDVSLKLVVHSKNTVDMPLSVNVSVQAMRHNGTPAVNIQSEVKQGTLQPGKGDSSSGQMWLLNFGLFKANY